MKNEKLIQHLASVDLSFLKVVKDEVVEVKNKIDLENIRVMFEVEQPENWNSEIELLETYFKNITPPTQPIRLNECTTINDVSLFVDSHLATVNANNGKQTFLPYLNRLQELKQILTIKSN